MDGEGNIGPKREEGAWRQAECAQQFSPWKTVVLEEQNVSQLLMKFRSFIDTETSLPLLQDPATGLHTTIYL